MTRWSRRGPMTHDRVGRRILLLDNYDSFTYNLYQYLRMLGADVEVVRNDEISVDDIARSATRRHRHLARSVAAGERGHHASSVIRRLGPTTPILGVCLGHQAIGLAYGGGGHPGRARPRQALGRVTTPARGSSRASPPRSTRAATTRWPSTARRCPRCSR